MNKKEESIIKEYYKKFKEAWKEPKKRAGIKLLGYLIFFIVLILVSYVTKDNNSYSRVNDIETTTTIVSDNYLDKQEDLINTKHNIKYVINKEDKEYVINGILDEGIIDGYLETNGSIKKIKIENDTLYEVKNDTPTKMELDIDYYLINIYNILESIKEKTSIIERDNKNKNYLYTIKNNNVDAVIKVYTNEKSIYKIELVKENDKYILNFDN